MIDIHRRDCIYYDYELQTIHNGFFMSPINKYGSHDIEWKLGNRIHIAMANNFGILIRTLRGWDDLRED